MVRNFLKVNFGDLEAVLDNFFREEFSYSHNLKPARLIKDKDGTNVLLYNVVGLGKDDIKIKFQSEYGQKKLHIEGHREDEFGEVYTFKNTFPVTKMIDESKVKAKVENGILKLWLPTKNEYLEKEIDISIE